ncbi:MAG: hypothetical protein PHE88_02020 [Elusimicrobia bacterium]|nr:hypothetical protein [Elusimicrobiota bacterium]
MKKQILIIILFVLLMFHGYLKAENEKKSIIISAGYHVFPDSDYFDYYDEYFKIRSLSGTKNLPGLSYEIEFSNVKQQLFNKFDFELSWGLGNYRGSIEHNWYLSNSEQPYIISGDEFLKKNILEVKVIYLKVIPKIIFNLNNKIKTFVGVGYGSYWFDNRFSYDEVRKLGGTSYSRVGNSGFNVAPVFSLGGEYKISERFGVVLQDTYANIPVNKDYVQAQESLNIGGNSIMLGLKTYF